MTDNTTTHIHKDWYVYQDDVSGGYFVVDTENDVPVHSAPASARDIAQATLRGKFRD